MGKHTGDMELAQLENFVVLADHLHFRRAAAAVGVSASTLSRQIGELEEDLGFRLFERNRRRVSLSPAGAAFLVETQALLHRLRFAAIDAARIARGTRVKLRIGHGDAVGLALLHLALPQLRAKCPDVRLEVIEGPSAELLDSLTSRALDIALLRPPVRAAGIDSDHLCDEELVVALPAGHRLCQQSHVSVADLAGEPLVVPPRSTAPGAYDVIIGLFAAERCTANVVEEGTSASSVFLLVAAGLGVAVTPVYATRHVQTTGIEVRPLAGRTTMALHVAWRLDDPNAAIPVLCTVLEHSVRKLAAADTGVDAACEAAAGGVSTEGCSSGQDVDELRG